MYSTMLQVFAGTLAQPRMPPRLCPFPSPKGNWTSRPLWGRKSSLKGNAHAVHSIISVPQELLPTRRGKLLFPQGLVFASWASRIPDIKQALDLNEAQLGGVLFAIPVGQMSAMALSGYLVSRFGSHRMLLLAALLYSGTLMALGFISETWQLFAMLVFFGVAANLHNISVNTQAVGVERLYRRSIMAAFHGLWSLAGFIGGITGALFAAFSVSTRVHFSFIFAVCMGIAAIMFRLTLPRDRARSTAPGHKRPKGKIDPYVVLLGLIAFGCMASEGTMYDWSAVYYEAIIKPSPELIRLGYIAYMCTMVCGRFMADGLVTRFGVIRILQASGALIASGLLISVLLPHVATATFGLALVGFGTASVVPVCYSMAGKSQIMHPSVALARGFNHRVPRLPALPAGHRLHRPRVEPAPFLCPHCRVRAHDRCAGAVPAAELNRPLSP